MEYQYVLNGKSLVLDESRCTGCGKCRDVCPHGVFALSSPSGRDGMFKVKITDRGLCMECGACALNCPFSAITVDHGVGCTAAIIGGLLRGTAPDCGCGVSCEASSKRGKKRKHSACC